MVETGKAVKEAGKALGLVEKLSEMNKMSLPEITGPFKELDPNVQVALILVAGMNQKPKQGNIAVSILSITSVIQTLAIIGMFIVS